LGNIYLTPLVQLKTNNSKEYFMRKKLHTNLNMFRLILPCLIVWLFTASTLNAQWYWQNPLPQGNALRCIHFFDANTILAMGMGGTIIRSNDGGTNWTIMPSFTTRSLYSTYFMNANVGFITSTSGYLYKTTDGGANWTETNVGVSGILYSIKFWGSELGIIAGATGRILRSTDGGNSWTLITTGTTQNLLGVAFADSAHIYAVGAGGTIITSTDAGLSWTAQTSGITTQLNAVEFRNSNLGIAVGASGRILRTTNGGVNWDLISATTEYLTAISFVDDNNGVIIGRALLKTTDSGVSWTTVVSTFNTIYMRAVKMFGNIGFGVGDSGLMYKTTDGGSSWNQVTYSAIPYNSPSGARAIAFTGDSTLVVSCENGKIAKTTNGGQNWFPVTTPVSGPLAHLFGLGFLDEFIGYAAGANGTVLKTTDGGDSWVIVSGFTGNIATVDFGNQINGIMAGLNIYYTTNGGNNWATATNPSGQFVNNLQFINDSVAIAVCQAGAIIRTSNGGMNWVQVASGVTPNLIDVDFVDPTTGIAVGWTGTITKTTDGGLTWIPQTSGTTTWLYAVSFDGVNKIYAGGNSGDMIKSTDGGTSWVPIVSGTANPIYALKFIYPDKGYLIGHVGTIMTNDPLFIPVELTSFVAAIKDNSVKLTWTTATELNNTGFEIYRLSQEAKNEWVEIGFVPGFGTTTESRAYSFIDDNLKSGKYSYRLKQIDYDGSFEYSKTIEVLVSYLPDKYSLYQNYPNPFNPVTLIKYQVPEASMVSIKVYDVIGREIAVLVNEVKNAGNYQVSFNSANLASGVYFYKMVAGDFSSVRKMNLLK
jgi:photosystem II stability/assembly factor-like uncharacterized protein